MRRLLLAAAALLVLTGCAAEDIVVSAQSPTPSPTAAPSIAPSAPAGTAMKACMLANINGVNDRGFNQTAWQGVNDAADQLGVEPVLAESQNATGARPLLAQFVNEGCSVIVTVGYPLADDTKAVANDNPDIPFTIVDQSFAGGDIRNDNVLGQVFEVDEPAYLAGYLAAATTKTGIVGTIGGMDIPPVVLFMKGFYNGVRAFNRDSGTDVQVIGYDAKDPSKSAFVGAFDDPAGGRKLARKQYEEGADIIMVAAGPTGLGAANFASKVGPDKLAIIGSDSDMAVADPANASVYLTSITKHSDSTTLQAIQSVVDGTFRGGELIGNLKNDGVGLAPLHDFESQVPLSMVKKLQVMQEQISDGTIDVSK